MIPSGIEPANFWLVAQCLNQFRHRVPDTTLVTKLKFQKVLYKVNVVPPLNRSTMQ